ncbi:aspartyl protease family protein 2-like [Lolium rigidum]|uniref:aspartyl protease family protein 2-like n=1 Tax=Lolium rigidum TaxID=89674 RepID=UPI001F5D26A0|nr:aspartyl protease family protein 2-like [Lolium rigidum]
MKIAVLIFLLLLSPLHASANSSAPLYGIEFPPYNTAVADSGCDGKLLGEEEELARRTPSLKLHMSHRSAAADAAAGTTRKDSFLDSAKKDAIRIDTMRTRQVTLSGRRTTASSSPRRALSERLVATVESGVAIGSGEYLVDVYVGTPPRRFQLIMDTGSDLNWLQCAPCLDCFEQRGPVFDPAASTSYRNVTCGDKRCGLVSPPPPAAPRSCRSPRSDPCPYFYWYGDQSNTTGDLALEAFTVNLTAAGATRRVDGVAFGCGHWNRGLFHGAAGLLGLGRGPLSFASQLRGVYGHAFSYCLVDHGSAVGSKIVFGDDNVLLAHPQLNYTAFAPAATADSADTFYYVRLKSILVGGEILNISQETLGVAKDGSGGTIIDSGTTLSYFPDPAYQVIRQAFIDRMDKTYPLIADFPVLSPCYNVSGVENREVPEFSLLFTDGAVWDFPAENYFIQLEPDIMCLAVLGTPRSAMSIIGNYQQQNFHVLYDLQNNRLGFAPRRCAEV